MNDQKASGQSWARFGLGLGAILSIVGNVAHTYLVESVVSLWLRVPLAMAWPAVLFIGIEVLVRVDWRRKFLDHTGRVLIWGPAGVVAAVVSYLHLHSLMTFAGESWFAALVGPLAIDGLMIGCTVALLAIRAATLAPAAVDVDTVISDEEAEQIVDRWTKSVGQADQAEIEAPPAVPETVVPILRAARTRAAAEEQRAAVQLILNEAGGTDTEIVADTGVSLATVRLYRAVYRELRNNPMADIGPKFQGRSVNPELVAVIRDQANRERAL